MPRGRHRRPGRLGLARQAAAAFPPLVALIISGGIAFTPVANSTSTPEPPLPLSVDEASHLGWSVRPAGPAPRPQVATVQPRSDSPAPRVTPAPRVNPAPRVILARAPKRLAPAPEPTVAPELKPAVRLPRDVEAPGPYVSQVSCDPNAKPGVVAFAQAALSTYQSGRSGGIVRDCSLGGKSEHKEGRAWDWMLDAHDPDEAKTAVAFLGWLTASDGENARRAGVMYVIWDGRIWSPAKAKAGWRPYFGPNDHSDHIHVSFSWAGAMKRTSWWTGTVAADDYGPCVAVAGQLSAPYQGPNPAPCPPPTVRLPILPPGGPTPWSEYPATRLQYNSRGEAVRALQTTLGLKERDGWFGPVTRSAVKRFQAQHGLTVDGIVGPKTWARIEQIYGPTAKK